MASARPTAPCARAITWSPRRTNSGAHRETQPAGDIPHAGNFARQPDEPPSEEGEDKRGRLRVKSSRALPHQTRGRQHQAAADNRPQRLIQSRPYDQGNDAYGDDDEREPPKRQRRIFRFCDQTTNSTAPAHAETKLSIITRVGRSRYMIQCPATPCRRRAPRRARTEIGSPRPSCQTVRKKPLPT